MDILSNNHWTMATYRQRMTTKQWREVLLNETTIVFNGTVCELRANNLGHGVVEVYKDIPANALIDRTERDDEKGGKVKVTGKTPAEMHEERDLNTAWYLCCALAELCAARPEKIVDDLTGYLWDEEEAGNMKYNEVLSGGTQSVPLSTTSAVADGSASDEVIEMGLCEVPHIFLRPNQLYRFVVMPGCKACTDAAVPYTQNAPNQSQS